MTPSQRGLQLIFQQHALKLWQEWQEHSHTSQHAHQLLLSTVNLEIFLKSMILNCLLLDRERFKDGGTGDLILPSCLF